MSLRCYSLSESRKRRIAHGQGRLMATQIAFDPLPPAASHVGRKGGSTLLRSLTLMTALFVCAIPAHAQLQSAFVFAADPANPKSVSVYTRNDVTGILTGCGFAFSEQGASERDDSRFLGPVPVY